MSIKRVSGISILVLISSLRAMEPQPRPGTPIPRIDLAKVDCAAQEEGLSAREDRSVRLKFSRDKSLKQLPPSPRQAAKQLGDDLAVPATPTSSPQSSPDRRTGHAGTYPLRSLLRYTRLVGVHDDSGLPVPEPNSQL